MKYAIDTLVTAQLGYQHRGRIDMGDDGTHQIVQIKDLDNDDRFLSSEFPTAVPHRLWTGSLYRVTPRGDADQYQVREGDVLFLYRGNRNVAVPMVPSAVQPYPYDWSGILAAYYFYILRPSTSLVTPEYLAWAINLPQTQAYLTGHARGSNMKMIPKQAIMAMEISVPDLATQQKITALQNLFHTERQLTTRLEQKRHQLIDAISMKAASWSS